ncbi:decaprenyl-phosphate phosphoribosyltransferase [bacterium]|nr:MAG: decaprenyl-phosphate phosphoribosyltransferase [bacterium]
MHPVLRLIRPKQWSKGLLVFAAPLFAQKLVEPMGVACTLLAFAAMSLISSAVYVLNDLIDVERDKAHPIKRERPIASGAVSVSTAKVLIVLLLAGGLALGAILNKTTVVILITYLLVQVAYNMRLKREPVADVFCLSLGFVLRASLGAAAVGVGISGWLLFCTGALALMLGFGKRRHEWILQGDSRTTSREVLGGYTRPVLDACLLMAAGGAAMSYGVYSIESPTAISHPLLIATALPVFYGIYRYMYLVMATDEGGEPENLLFRDRHIVSTVVVFALLALLALSTGKISILETVAG